MGPSTQRGKKNEKDRRRPTNSALVATANHTGKQPQQGLPDHFNELMESSCTNHTYPVKHHYKDYELLSAFYVSLAGQRKEKARRQQPRKGAWWARIRTTEGPYMATEVIQLGAY